MGHGWKIVILLGLASAGITGWALLEMTKQSNLVIFLSALALC